MPTLLTIPRELRDEIYNWALLTPLTPAPPSIQIARRRIGIKPKLYLRRCSGSIKVPPPSPSSSPPLPHLETGYIPGEEVLRYPISTPLPATHPLLSTCRQLRAELHDALKRAGHGVLRYKLDLASRHDLSTLYPTWVEIPMFATHIDVLDVQLRVRSTKTGSVCSADAGDEEREWDGDVFKGGLACLQRFLERGVHFLSKKKRESLSVGVLAIDADRPADVTRENFLEAMGHVVKNLEQWMSGRQTYVSERDGEGKVEEEDRQFRFLAGRVGRLRIGAGGEVVGEWDLREMVKTRDVSAKERERDGEEVVEGYDPFVYLIHDYDNGL